MEIEYSELHWKLLAEKRDRAMVILSRLRNLSLEGNVYGSVARGDVNKDSDIDIIIFYPDLLKLDLIEADHKFIVQATPFSTPKAYISLDLEEKEVISFPLSKLSRKEVEFYYFGGMINAQEIQKGLRVVGVNKKLMIIIPSEKGHLEIPLKGNEDYAAKLLKNVSYDTIFERERLLTKREERGHTGVFLKYVLDKEESFENAIRNLYKNNKYFRRAIDAER
ncbi:nucleotidyltransferase domain-containing protein [Stygiolobus caldivivus]|uniref:protein adenylyltransferase n=1 Tax=Stygiolobus caldivivus TaxID=2824673 RepID=A0A8D5ZGX6_9CREN|nr:nucleotidyltransferase domain-containing protein [Stygiolobus caldivivus]BCU69209.1 DNA polymerase subunit beta [Stygiolobus caldivivus]